ncbi:MAG: hypothetical protein PVF05_02685 [Gemmatimonadales bacterium]|jgi:hypothetical protein
MDEHLTREQIAALLDEPDAVAGGLAHLDVCSDCASEFEGMSRMRMALSGLPDFSAPENGWERVRDALPSSALEAGGRGRPIALPSWLQGRWSPLLTAAAIIVLFFGGLGVGRTLAPRGGAAPGRVADNALEGVAGDAGLASSEERGVEAALAADYPEYLRTVAELRSLRDTGPSSAQIASDPALAAERLTRLDALIEASREALQDAPADPALNDFLFDVVDERASVAGQLNQTIRQASMEY